jgi:hypothetical protein
LALVGGICTRFIGNLNQPVSIRLPQTLNVFFPATVIVPTWTLKHLAEYPQRFQGAFVILSIQPSGTGD